MAYVLGRSAVYSVIICNYHFHGVTALASKETTRALIDSETLQLQI